MVKKEVSKAKKQGKMAISSLFKSEHKFMITVVLVSIVVFAIFILILDASITGAVVKDNLEDSKLDSLFFVMTVFGMVLFLGSMLFYYLNTKQENEL